ncbi:hypothetical protein [Neobacillus sp. PS3-40]|uniref:hypothetical protein n=1 Tax=Neobacillus sp. PS3-40 TaxID=3070679 RepID=UPI0027DEC7D8|nr:hypothetical protein [Neobacillus sp. PS3-40]WML42703.1 hypothetical protein RCG20_12715 [Neobacillus sp. PS3-40]
MSEEQKKLYELKVINQLMKQFIGFRGMNEDWEDYQARHMKRSDQAYGKKQ